MKPTEFKYTMVVTGPEADRLIMAGQFIGSKEPSPPWLDEDVAKQRAYVADQKKMQKYEGHAPKDGISRMSAASLGTQQYTHEFTYNWFEDKGIPEAFVLLLLDFKIFLVSLTVHPIPNLTTQPLHFICNSWVDTFNNTQLTRTFFVNKSYLPSQTPGLVGFYRKAELKLLRGDIDEIQGDGVRKEWDRIYEYATYNDLGDVDASPDLARPTLGGSTQYPYPRRLRTGRAPSENDPSTESRLPADQAFSIYVPRDDQFSDQKLFEFLQHFPKSLMSLLKTYLSAELEVSGKEFESFEHVLKVLYKDGFTFNVPKAVLDAIAESQPIPTPPENGDLQLLFPIPSIIQDNLDGWMTDEEFAREMLAGVNPVSICLLQEFPIKRSLDIKLYGDHASSITREHLEKNMNGLTVYEALNSKRLFILNHYDAFMPYLRKINESSTRKAYASRTILFLQNDGTLKPLAIELSLPHPDGDQFGAISKVYLPETEGVEGTIWQLAKAYVVVNDTGYHQLISHWLNTHAVMEPFVIATYRQLSQLHPMFKLIHPHYHDTLFINALGRQNLISADGIIENSFLPGKYSMEMSSVVYKSWNFLDEALPADLIKRGMAVEDPTAPHGLRLLIKDYPYAVDGLLIWDAIKTWVHDYVSYYYESDEIIKQDPELQSWWKELVEEGHGDLKDKDWWPKMQTRQELIHCCTIIIWIASALHAAVNFGQYPYGGYILNRPTLSRRLMPEKGTQEYAEMEKNPQLAFLKTITPKFETLLDLSIIEILSSHTTDEVYLGTNSIPYWTSDGKVLEAFKKFGDRLKEIEKVLIRRNEDGALRNRVGPVMLPYTLLYPSSEPGLTGRGIPNSITI